MSDGSKQELPNSFSRFLRRYSGRRLIKWVLYISTSSHKFPIDGIASLERKCTKKRKWGFSPVWSWLARSFLFWTCNEILQPRRLHCFGTVQGSWKKKSLPNLSHVWAIARYPKINFPKIVLKCRQHFGETFPWTVTVYYRTAATLFHRRILMKANR